MFWLLSVTVWITVCCVPLHVCILINCKTLMVVDTLRSHLTIVTVRVPNKMLAKCSWCCSEYECLQLLLFGKSCIIYEQHNWLLVHAVVCAISCNLVQWYFCCCSGWRNWAGGMFLYLLLVCVLTCFMICQRYLRCCCAKFFVRNGSLLLLA